MVRTKYICTYKPENTNYNFDDSTYKLKVLTFIFKTGIVQYQDEWYSSTTYNSQDMETT